MSQTAIEFIDTPAQTMHMAALLTSKLLALLPLTLLVATVVGVDKSVRPLTVLLANLYRYHRLHNNCCCNLLPYIYLPRPPS